MFEISGFNAELPKNIKNNASKLKKSKGPKCNSHKGRVNTQEDNDPARHDRPDGGKGPSGRCPKAATLLTPPASSFFYIKAMHGLVLKLVGHRESSRDNSKENKERKEREKRRSQTQIRSVIHFSRNSVFLHFYCIFLFE